MLTLHLANYFFFTDTATTEIYTLSLHDALPICEARGLQGVVERAHRAHRFLGLEDVELFGPSNPARMQPCQYALDRKSTRLNSSHSQISYAVFCLKKKKKDYHNRLLHQQTSYNN